ncbi:MAG TPA: FtsQ-type POTRA domain-containing protein [Haliangiales bacterium]|nr:FtsQ-type POTRA domain-containing protein [Haliangiales bacterium]
MTQLRSPVVPRNRRIRQRRRLRSVLPAPRALAAAAGRALRRAAPALVAAAAAGAIATGVFFGVRWLSRSPRFAVGRIDVSGNAHVTREEILRRAAIAPGVNVFALSVRDAEDRLRRSPWIADARVERSLPDGIAIAVVERRAQAMVAAEGKLYLVDEAGSPFKRAEVDRGEGAGLLVVSGLGPELYRSDPAAAAALVRFALAIAADWRSSPERPAVGEVHLARDGVTLYTLEKATAIAVGRGERAAFDRFDDVWNALSPDERAAARTIYLNQRTRTGRAVVTLGNATR